MTVDVSALCLVEKLIENYSLINQDLVEECLDVISLHKNDFEIRSSLAHRLETQPSLLLFKIAQRIQQRPTRIIFDKVKDDPMLLLNFLTLMEVQESNDSFSLSYEDLNHILEHENFLLLDKVKRNFHFFIKDGESAIGKLDFSNPFSLLYLENSQSSPCNQFIEETGDKEHINISIEGLLQAIEKSIAYSFQIDGCICSKHHECYDY